MVLGVFREGVMKAEIFDVVFKSIQKKLAKYP